ncbi:hypothetical protein [Roseomonas sp. BN140053]|uniref:hypothetical protein n=1 Tax=Roseomonas sp. BN140053 TaxID=3391898 RepID=UPI0039E8A131
MSQAASSRPAGSDRHRMGWGRTVFFVLLCLLIAYGTYDTVREQWPLLRTDMAVQDRAQPAPNARVLEGSCRTFRLFLTRCEATLEASARPGASWQRRVAYDYFGSFDERPVRVLLDPQQPELLTTDAALDRLRNRLVAQVFAGLFGATCLVAAVVLLVRRLR